jgi:hypothetical protein
MACSFRDSLGNPSQVPFSENSGLEARLAQETYCSLLGHIKALSQSIEPVLMAVFAGQDGSPAGRTDGIGAEYIGKPHPVTGNPVNIDGFGLLGKNSLITDDRLSCMIVGHDEKDIGLRLFSFAGTGLQSC